MALMQTFSVGIFDSGTALLVVTTSAYSTLRSHFFKNFCGVSGLCVGRSLNSGSTIDARHPNSRHVHVQLIREGYLSGREFGLARACLTYLRIPRRPIG